MGIRALCETPLRAFLRTYFKTSLEAMEIFSNKTLLRMEFLSPPLKKGDLGGFQEVI
jgi:hypothetical protein